MAQTTLAHLLVRLGVDASEFQKRMRSAEKTTEKIASGMKKAGNTLSLYVTAPMLAVSGAALKMAIDANESENLFSVAMGEMADKARSFSEDLRTQFGLNSYAVRENIATFHQMLTSMGLSEKAAYDVASGMTQLGYDMASFFNLKPEEAFEKLRAGITGEAEPLKRLGILVNDTTIKQEAYNAGLVATGDELDEVQKVQARYLAIMRQTSNAQGDLARTADEPANRLRRLREQAEETAIRFGTALLPLLEASLPVVEDLSEYVRRAADAFAEMDPETKKLAVGVAGVLIAAGPLNRAFSGIFALGRGVAGVFKTAAKQAAKLAKAKKAAAAAAPTLISGNVQAAQAMQAAATQAAIFKGGLVVLAGAAGWAIGSAIRPWVNEVLGLNEALGLVAEKTKDLLDALIENEEVFHNQLYAYNAARKSLGLMSDEWIVQAEHTKENAGQLAHLLTELEKVREAHRQEAFAIQESTAARGDAITQVNRHLERIKKEEDAFDSITEDLREMYDVMNQKDVEEQMRKLVADFTILSRDGVPAAELMKAFGPDVEKLSEAAGNFINTNMPDEFLDMKYALESNEVGVESLAVTLRTQLPDAATQARTALESSIGDAMLNAKTKVDQETAEIRNILVDLAGEEYKIKVMLDTEAFQRQLKELGIQPDTTGTAP